MELALFVQKKMHKSNCKTEQNKNFPYGAPMGLQESNKVKLKKKRQRYKTTG